MKWIGKGVLRHKKKFFGYGDTLPDDLGEDLLKRLIAEGKAGDIIEPPQATNRVIELEAEMLEQAKRHAAELDAAMGELKAAKAEITRLKKGAKK